MVEHTVNWHRLYQIAALCGAFGCVDIQLYVVWGVLAAEYFILLDIHSIYMWGIL